MAEGRRRPGPAKGANYRKRPEIERSLVDAVIALVMERPPEEITAGAVAERAGVSPAYVSRYGGGLRNLLMVAAREMAVGELADWSPGAALTSPQISAAIRLVAFLLASGMPASELYGEGSPLLGRIAENFQSYYGFDMVEAHRAARIAFVFSLGYRAFGEASGLTDDDARYLLGRFDQLMRDVAAEANGTDTAP